jgi:hypothetical protein
LPELIPFIASTPLRSPLHRLLRLEQGSAGARQSRCGAGQDTLEALAKQQQVLPGKLIYRLAVVEANPANASQPVEHTGIVVSPDLEE